MGAKGREFVAAEFNWEQVAKQFVSMYEDVMELFGGKKALNVLRPSDSNQPED
jgi:hypothetical protein